MYGRGSYPLLLIEGRAMPSKKKNNVSKKVAFCGIMGAVSVLILYLGSLIDVLDLSMSVIASVAVVIVVIEVGYSYAWMTYAAAGLLAILILPKKLAAIFFLIFMGYYPILKSYIEGLKNGVLRWLLKLLSAHAALAVFYLVVKLFMPEELETGALLAAIYIVAVVGFVLYDIAITQLISLYFCKFRDRLRIYKLLK